MEYTRFPDAADEPTRVSHCGGFDVQDVLAQTLPQDVAVLVCVLL